MASFAPAQASARPAPMPGSGEVAGRGFIGFDLDAVYWQGNVVTPAAQGELWLRDHGPGVFGYRRVPGSLSAGFALNEWLALGARIDWAVEPREGTVTVRGGLSPYARLYFARDRNVRPFALLRAGMGRSNTVSAGDDGIRAVGPRTWYPTIGAGLGTNVFITEVISFDAAATIDQRWNLVRPLAEPGAPADASAASWRYRDTTISAGLALGFSHWF